MTSVQAPLTTRYRQAVLAHVDRFKAETGMRDSRISRNSVGESEFVTRLRAGDNVTLAKVARLELWLTEASAELNAARKSAKKKTG